MNRLKLLLILAVMPEEAFGWFVSWCCTGYTEVPGVFHADAKKTIKALRDAAVEYQKIVRRSS